ncbi:MAG: hypothetical protein R6X02_03370 [Enhygromyxa sp.]
MSQRSCRSACQVGASTPRAFKSTTSVADLRELVAANPSLVAVTLTEFLGGGKAQLVRVRGKAPSEFVSLKDKPSAHGRSAKGADWDTRTEAGREAFDRAVLEAIAAFGGIGVSAVVLGTHAAYVRVCPS